MSSDDGWGPDRFPRRSVATSKRLSFDELKVKCLGEGRLYEDPDFAEFGSKYILDDSCEHEWKRPQEILGDSGVPEFYVDGISRFDIKQGEIGNCWFLAAVAALSEHEGLLENVIPPGQDFKPGSYAGIFHFNFWWFGKWTEVIIDDRLPVCGGQLASLKSSAKNEFWSPLLEKAYAKLYGSYKALDAGLENEAFEDFTGGLGESFPLKPLNPEFREEEFWPILLTADEKGSLLGAAIFNPPGHEGPEGILPNGLVTGHAYSITSVREVHLGSSEEKRKQELVRIRNPWGNAIEWNGPWSDKSDEWKSISDSEKQSIGLIVEEDGEFWMSYQDFANNYHQVEVCSLGPDSGQLKTGKGKKRRWEMTKHEGSWIKGVNAGGIPGSDTYWTNPQYQFEVLLPGGAGSETAIIALMQKERRKISKESLAIGIVVYKIGKRHKDQLLPRKFLENEDHMIYTTGEFESIRETTTRLKLSTGCYCVVPMSYDPNDEADFLLRIYTETPITSRELDEETAIQKPRLNKSEIEENLRKKKDKPSSDEDWFSEEMVREIFKEIAGEDLEIDAYKLRNILNLIFADELQCEDGFSVETCKSLVASKDLDFSGKLGFEEFEVFVMELILWTLVFMVYEDEKDKGRIKSYLLREMLKDIGISISNQTFSAIVQRYSHEDGKIHFDDFIHAATRLTTMLTIFEQNKQTDETAKFNMDQFIQTTMYS